MGLMLRFHFAPSPLRARQGFKRGVPSHMTSTHPSGPCVDFYVAGRVAPRAETE